MYMALTEEQAKEIRKLGIQPIEWKNCVRRGIDVLSYSFLKANEESAEMWNRIREAMGEIADEICLVINEIKDRFHLQTSRRYKFVKILGNIGYAKQRVWTLTRHTRLARSDC